MDQKEIKSYNTISRAPDAETKDSKAFPQHSTQEPPDRKQNEHVEPNPEESTVVDLGSGQKKQGESNHIETTTPSKESKDGKDEDTGSNNLDTLDVSNLPRTESRVSFAESEKRYTYDPNKPSRNGSIASGSDKRQPSTGDLLDSIDISNQTMVQKYASCRWTTTYMCFGSIMLSVMLRQCMSMAIVCMENNNILLTTNQSLGGNRSDSYKHDVTIWMITWDSQTQGLVLSSYFYGFPLTSVLGGYLSGKFSGKKVVALMTGVIIVTSFLIPICAIYNVYLVVVLRCIIGFASGGLTPSVAAILSKWAPLQERAQINAVASSGLITGTTITFALSGLICDIPTQNGWPFIFYIFGGVNVLGLFLWLCMVYDYPDEHPRIDWKEKILILKNRRDSTFEKMPSPPWLKILTSGPFWGLLCAHVAHGFLFTTIGTFLPIYMNDVLRFDAASNGLLSSLPFIGRLIGTYVSGYVADMLLIKGVLSITVIRKLFHFLGMAISAPFLLALSFLDYTQRDIVVVLLIIYWTTQAMNNAGFRVNHLDIAPRFAGVLNGMTGTCASIAALISPLVTSALTQNGTREEWQVVFGICIAVGLGGAFVFVTIGSAQEQEWAKDPNWNDELHVRRLSTIIDEEMRRNSSLSSQLKEVWTKGDILKNGINSSDGNTKTNGRPQRSENPDGEFDHRITCEDELDSPKIEFSFGDRDIDRASIDSMGFERSSLEENSHHHHEGKASPEVNNSSADDTRRSDLKNFDNMIFTDDTSERNRKSDVEDDLHDLTPPKQSDSRRSSLRLFIPEINIAFVDENDMDSPLSPTKFSSSGNQTIVVRL
ncbi:hypothetical protein FSP39_004610 [Pinctada imbricata]|uniref:Major facilitator superfamily (MFS) profile domain-containing protein n=1 Tax=Pinctada imbricata TaxID=66713 RepID=A0AA89C3L8_PINIB|nr:hypothetical protein FSP39_004610 [Pinctada imbricata]